MPSRRGRPLDLVVLGNAGGRRLELLDLALTRCGMPPARVVPYIAYLRGEARLADVIREGSVLRIESPGQDFEVERAILAEGIDLVPGDTAARLGREELDQLPFERGRVHCPKQWSLGFSRLLAQIEQDRAVGPAHAVMNDERSIAVLFDKRRCHDRLTAQGIPCPRVLGPVGSYQELRRRMGEAGVGRVFVKLACGSSGSGIAALESSGPRTQAFTTAEMVEQGGRLLLYNSRRIRRIADERSIARLVDALAAEGVHVEQWVPKAGLDGHAFDVRVVVIAGRPEHAVVRLSRSPMTNLHLKNRRGNVDVLRARMGDAAWEALLGTCGRISDAFPGCQYLGVDVAVLPGYRRHSVLEVNAFGDLLPAVLDRSGRDTYTAEIEALVRSPGGGRPMIRAIFFDLDGTLVDRSAAHGCYCLSLMARRPDVFAPERRDADLRTLLGKSDRDRFAFARRVAAVFSGLGTPAELATDHARGLPGFIEPDAMVVRLIEGLKGRYVLGVVSNGSGPLQRAKLDAAGLSGLFGREFISGEEGASKPHAVLFRKALTWARTAPGETLFVGDDPTVNIAGAAQVGMKTCWVSHGSVYPDGVPRPERTIECVQDLPEVLP